MRKDLIAILAVFIIVACTWNALIPPYENLDELEHAEVVRHITTTGRLPVHGEAENAGYHVRQEASQPPLYHILAAGWSRMWRLPTLPHAPEAIPSDVVACGPADTFYNKATWTRIPDMNEPLRTLYSVRLLSTLLQAATVAGTWALARRVFPHGPIPALAAIIVGFNPQFLLVASGVNNDNVITPLATWGLVIAYDMGYKGPTARRVAGFGVVSGMAALSKLSGLGLLGIGGLALLIYAWQHKMSLRNLIGWGFLMTLPVVLIVTPWMLRNVQLYGDPTALTPMLEKVGRRTYPIAFSEIKPMLLSYWGQMPCAFYPRAVYWPYFVLMIGGFVGTGLGWWRFNRQQKLALSLCAIWFIVIVLAWVRWNSITPATGGRLLFPAIAAMALILAGGWHTLFTRLSVIWAAILPIWAVVTLVVGPVAFFALPPLLPTDSEMPNPRAVIFGDVIAMRGFEARIVEPHLACIVASTSYCGPALDVTLYWQATQPLTQNLTMVLQLVSPVPGETDVRLNYHHWPAHGNLPTSAWPVGPVLRDHYVLPIPESEDPTQAWRLQIAFIDGVTHARLPTYEGHIPTGDAAQLTIVRVPGNPERPEITLQTMDVQFGEAINLTGASVDPTSTEWHVTLRWESLSPLPVDYTVFVHAVANGDLLTTGDGPPQQGHFPTHLWQPGDVIHDVHTLSPPGGKTPVRIMVGLYNPLTGERLPATGGGTALPDSAVLVGEVQP